MICEVYKSRLVKLFSVFVILKKQKNWTPIVNTHCIKIGVQLWAEWRDLNPQGNRWDWTAHCACMRPWVLFVERKKEYLHESKYSSWSEWRDLNPRGNRPQAAASPPPAGLDGALRLHEAVGSVCGTKKGVLT